MRHPPLSFLLFLTSLYVADALVDPLSWLTASSNKRDNTKSTSASPATPSPHLAHVAFAAAASAATQHRSRRRRPHRDRNRSHAQ